MARFFHITPPTGKYFRALKFQTAVVLAAGFLATTILSGCGLGAIQADNSTDTTVVGFSGVLHGGPSPVIGSRVVIYATTSTGYGVGQVLQEATQVGASAHQDTDSNGTFSFAGGFTCPAGQYAYIAAYGGNTGANSNNPNLVLMAALGSCSSLYSGTTYTGSNILVNELTTVAAGYALSNFINVTGTSTSGYTVGIGAPATNNATTACVANTYYTSTLSIPCPTTSASGLGHAFTNATRLVNNSTGTVNATETNGASVPVAEINSIANIMQSCVNSNGGGTTGGTPNSAITSSGTSNDGTICGEFFAYSSYTTNGLQTGTNVTAGNTLTATVNMAKHPFGSPSTFNSTCASNSTGSTTAATCLYNLAAANGFYNNALAAAPPDWSIAIYYPKGSFNTATNSVVCSGSTTPATNGLLYPYFLATDINDNIVIANSDVSTTVCMNVIYAGFDGAPISASTFDNTGALLSSSISVDSFGHAIVPVHGAGGLSNPNNGVRIYSYDASAVQLLTTYEPTVTASPLNDAIYVGVDQNDTIWVSSQTGSGGSDIGWLTLNGSNSHASPSYTPGATSTAVTSNVDNVGLDIHGNEFTTAGSSTGGERVRAVPAQIPSGTTNATQAASGTAPGATTTTSNGVWVAPDTNGTVWTISSGSGTDTIGTGVPAEVSSTAYTTNGSGVFTAFASTGTLYAGSVPSEAVFSVKPGSIDGNGIIWWPDNQGTATAGASPSIYPAYLHAFDTGSISGVTPYYLPVINGCQFAPSVTYSIASSVIGASSTVFTMTTTGNPPATGGVITLSGFPGTSSFYTGSVTVASNTVGAGSTNSTFTVNSNFGQAAGSDSDTGSATAAADSNHCGSVPTDASYPNNQAYSFYGSRGLTIDSAGDVWVANGSVGKLTEVIGIAAPTWPQFIHNGTSNKP